MKSMRHTTVIAVATGLATCSSAAWAAPVTESDSSAFTYKYEMEVDPTTQDLDGDANNDWAPHVGGVTVSGGVASIDAGRLVGTGTSIWQTSGLNAAATWTLEVRAHVDDPNPAGSRGYWGISTSNSTGTFDQLIEVSSDTTISARGSIDALITSDYTAPVNPKSGFTNLRIARDSDGLWIWQDNVLLNPDTPAQGFDNSLVINRLFIGRYSSALNGVVDVDYVRMTSGALAPVGQVIPEPASLGLMGSGALLLLRRRAR